MIEQFFLHQKQYSLTLRSEPISKRVETLEKLEKIIEENQAQVVAALNADFSKPELETLVTEIYPLLSEIEFTKRHLKKWARPEKVSAGLTMITTTNWLIYEPRGVCLIISPWNYPFGLAMTPLVSAIAAGNCATIKPSELAPATSKLIADLINNNFPEEHLKVIEGGVDTTTSLLKQPFDHIFFTGSTAVGKIVMQAASQHLSTVTLELGGKSPLIVDSTADLKMTAEKIVWGKFLNAGQTCVAPDYLYIHESVYDELISLIKLTLNESYGNSSEKIQNNPDFARIISPKHFHRLREMLEEALSQDAKLITGGQHQENDRFIAPTLLENVKPQSRVMEEEIFGPLLPVIKFRDLNEAVHFINSKSKPLALYLFSSSKLNIEKIRTETSSGGLVINDLVIHLGNHHLPFGGVGESGMGNYHGIFGFKNFSHTKAVMRQSGLGRVLKHILYPPYTPFKLSIIRNFIKWRF